MNFTVLRFYTLDSTNAEALRQARADASEGLCIIADRQTAGRGRYGREWRSDAGSGLYFSFVLRPKLAPEQLPLITLMAGVAACDALRTLGIDADLKWVNDLLVNERKIGGILCEAGETPTGVAVVVGIGVNVRSTMLTGELTDSATSVERELGESIEKSTDVLHSLEGSLMILVAKYYAELSADGGPAAILGAWRRRSTYCTGKAVRVSTANETFTGVTDGLAKNGALRIVRDNGTVTVVAAGDIERLRAAD